MHVPASCSDCSGPWVGVSEWAHVAHRVHVMRCVGAINVIKDCGIPTWHAISRRGGSGTSRQRRNSWPRMPGTALASREMAPPPQRARQLKGCAGGEQGLGRRRSVQSERCLCPARTSLACGSVATWLLPFPPGQRRRQECQVKSEARSPPRTACKRRGLLATSAPVRCTLSVAIGENFV